MNNQKLFMRIRALIDGNMDGRGAGILTSVSQDDHPHATWMGTICCPSIDRIVTMTSPDSRKVCNILENPRVEWLFTENTMKELLYLRGTAKVVNDINRVEKAWHQMPDKSRAYFLPYQKCGITFLIIETHVDSIEYRLPEEEQSWFLSTDDFPAVAAEK